MTEAFSDCGISSGIRGWSIKSFTLEPLLPSQLGHVYTGDSYIFLNSIKIPETGKLHHDIHFWLGTDSSIDEQGSAAIFATQLDDHLGGGPVQYRQVQGSEDEVFMKLFPKLIVHQGGCHESGFRSAASDKGPAKLYLIHCPPGTKASVKVMQIPASVTSLNSGDSFVLEEPASASLFIWHGSGANPIREKNKAVEVANAMRMNTSIMVKVVDEDDRESDAAIAFYKALGAPDISKVSIQPASAKAVALGTELKAPRLFRLIPDSTPDELNGPFSRAQLSTDGQFAVLSGCSIWVWSGSGTPKDVSSAAFAQASKLLSHLELPTSYTIRCIKEGHEPGLFNAFFSA